MANAIGVLLDRGVRISMAIIGEWIRRLGYLLRRRAREDELRREMEAHRAQMGEPPAFGNTLRLREEARDAWGWRWLDDLVHDTRFALADAPPQSRVRAHGDRDPGARHRRQHRHVQLRQRPAAAAAVRTAPTKWWRSDSDSTTPSGGSRDFSYPNYRDLQEGTTDIFASLAASSTGFVGLDAGDGPRRALASAVTANYFQVFGAPLAHGRPFTTEEERPGAGIRVAIISFPLWEQLGAGPEHARPARAHQRRTVHGRRRGAGGIRGDEHPRTRSLDAARRVRDVQAWKTERDARSMRARRTSWRL